MRKPLIVLRVIGVMALTACTMQVVPPAVPTAEPVSERVTRAVELTTNPWLWTSFTGPVQTLDVELPEQYTIAFSADGTLSIQADCNRVTGSYTADDSGSLTIALGASTLAACPPGSRGDEFVQKLGFVRGFFFENGALYLDMLADGGTFKLESAPESAPTADTLSEAALGNATYSGIYDEGPVTLTDGLCEGEPVDASSAARPRVRLIDAGTLTGDLDGDGSPDAAVILAENSGGSGQFTFLAVQLNRDSRPVDAGAVLIGDRTQIKAAAIVDGAIELEIVTQGPNDALCCPTQKVAKRYALQDGVLTEVASEDLGAISADDLNGTTWTLVDLNVDSQPVLEDAPITLSFADGQITGSGGCNTYSSAFTLDEVNPAAISIAAPAATRMACPDEVLVQETTFLAALEHAAMWGYQVGRLALFYEKNSQFGTLLFAPQTASAPTAEAAFGDGWASASCETLGVAPEIAAVADCGYVTVPENRTAGTADTIQLAVVRVRSTAANPDAPVVLGTGGPGGNGLQSTGDASFLTTNADILADRDWVFFTQRGTVQAKPELTCLEYNMIPFTAAQEGWTDGEQEARLADAMQACLDELVAQGVDFTGYNSVENATDIVDIARALGYDKINYYGESYGTLLGQFLLRNHPEILETITLDGIAPASAQRWTDVTKFDKAFQRVWDACAADPVCNANYPHPEEMLAKALAAMDANPPVLTLNMPAGSS